MNPTSECWDCRLPQFAQNLGWGEGAWDSGWSVPKPEKPWGNGDELVILLEGHSQVVWQQLKGQKWIWVRVWSSPGPDLLCAAPPPSPKHAQLIPGSNSRNSRNHCAKRG